jgi:hypothetical protein
MTTDRFAAESCTARTTAPLRLRRLGVASSPLKLLKIRRPHEPKPFGPALKHLHLLRGHAGDGPPAHLPGGLLKPQATEKARNGRDEQLATMDSQLRRTLSRGCSIALFWANVEQELAPLPRDGLILQPLGGCRPQAIAHGPGLESSGDPQPWNRVECDRRDRDASSGWAPHQSPRSSE